MMHVMLHRDARYDERPLIESRTSLLRVCDRRNTVKCVYLGLL